MLANLIGFDPRPAECKRRRRGVQYSPLLEGGGSDTAPRHATPGSGRRRVHPYEIGRRGRIASHRLSVLECCLSKQDPVIEIATLGGGERKIKRGGGADAPKGLTNCAGRSALVNVLVAGHRLVVSGVLSSL